MCDISNGGEWLDAALQLIPVVDFTTDILVVVSTILSGGIAEDKMYLAGFILFCISQAVRLFSEGTRKFRYAPCCESCRGCCDLKFSLEDINCDLVCCLPCDATKAIYWIVLGAYVVLLKVIRILLAIPRMAILPLEALLALGIRSATGECQLLFGDGFWFYGPEKDFFHSQNMICQFYNMVTSLGGGGRWLAMVYWKWAVSTRSQPNLRLAEDATKRALLEEGLENIGGLLMSVSVLLQDWPQDGGFTIPVILALVSIVFAVLSAIYETGHFWGRISVIKKADRRKGNAQDEEEQEEDHEQEEGREEQELEEEQSPA